MEDGEHGAAECVLAVEEGGFAWEGMGRGIGGEVVSAARRGGFEDVEGEAEALEGAV